MTGDRAPKKISIERLGAKDLVTYVIIGEIELEHYNAQELITLRDKLATIDTAKLNEGQAKMLEVFRLRLNVHLDKLLNPRKNPEIERLKLEAWITAALGELRSEIFSGLGKTYTRYQAAEYLDMLDYAGQEIKGIAREDVRSIKNPEEYKTTMLQNLKDLFSQVTSENNLRGRCLAIAKETLDRIFA